MFRRFLRLVAAFALVPSAALADGEPRLPDLRPVHVRDGVRDVAPQGDLARAGETEIGKLAAAVGLDLLRTENPLLAAQRKGDRLFYVFWKTTANAFGHRPYLLQRIRKTDRTWATKETKEPTETTTYQVEVFRLMAGRLKRPDQHHGSFGLHGAHRREVVKTYEIGFGEIPGVCEGTGWPFGDSLFRLLQPYQAEPGLHPQVRFRAARAWSLSVSLDADGGWRVTSPELGFDAPKAWPEARTARTPADPTSKDVVLEPGVGVAGVRIGETTAEGLIDVLGPALEDVEAGKGHRLMSFGRSLTCNLDPEGRLKTVITRPGFSGKTKEGVAHDLPRAKVMELLGAPKGQAADAADWTFPGLVVNFDAFDRVVRLVVTRR